MNTKGILLSLTLVLWGRPQLGAAKANDACATPCNCVTRIDKILTYHKGRVATARANYNSNIHNLLRLVLATVQADGQQKAKLIPVLGAAGKTLEDCKAELTAAEADLPMVTAALTALAKTYTIYNSLIKKTSTLTLTADSSGHFKNTGIAGQATHENSTTTCEEESTAEEKAAINSANVNVEPDLPALTITGVTTLTCEKATGSTDSCHNNQIGDTGYIKAVINYQTGTATTDASSWGSNTRTPGAKVVTRISLNGDNKTSVDAAMAKIKASKVHLKCAPLLTSYGAVANDEEFKQLVIKALLGKEGNEKTTAESVTDYNNAIEEAYGEGGTDYEAKVWTKVKETQAEINKGANAGNEPLESIDTLAKLTAAIARKLNKDLAEASRPKPQNKIESEKEKGCTEETDKAKCNKKTGCKYNEKDSKCEEDPEKTAAAAAPTTTTNTTGSNFFAIYKTPLWLAVFDSMIKFVKEFCSNL
uniref:Variant surface glycoprotein 1125.386 n=1 Tax=Trypanosoma brucei TaxID=5691 RepID=A0A1J0R5R3_9TRYP|nr:variant surface glycoprotein 1125.386 [Trypanosoma brucei]